MDIKLAAQVMGRKGGLAGKGKRKSLSDTERLRRAEHARGLAVNRKAKLSSHTS